MNEEVKATKMPSFAAEMWNFQGDSELPGFLYLRLTSPLGNEAWWELRADIAKPEDAAFYACIDWKHDLLETYRQQFAEKEKDEARS